MYNVEVWENGFCAFVRRGPLNSGEGGVVLNVEENNVKAMEFYERCGFKCTVKRPIGHIYTKVLENMTNKGEKEMWH